MVQTAAPEDRISETVADIVMLEKKIQMQIDKIAKKQATAIDIITKVSDSNMRQVHTLYYLPNERPLTIKEVADRIGYSIGRTRQIIDAGIDEAQSYYNGGKV